LECENKFLKVKKQWCERIEKSEKKNTPIEFVFGHQRAIVQKRKAFTMSFL
jgi:hypothetical protein